MRDSPSPTPSLDEAQMSSNHSSSVSSSPSHTERTAETTRTYLPQCSAPSRNKPLSRWDVYVFYEQTVFSFTFQTRWTTGCRRATVCWGIPLVWRMEPGSRTGLQRNTARRTRGATLTEVCVVEVSTWCHTSLLHRDFESHLFLIIRGCQPYLNINVYLL